MINELLLHHLTEEDYGEPRVLWVCCECVCMCLWACVYTCMYTYACLETRVWVSSSITLNFFFLLQCLSVNLGSWIQLEWLSSKIQGILFFVFAFPVLGLQAYTTTLDFLWEYWGSKLRSSHLSGKFSTNWAITQTLSILLSIWYFQKKWSA